MTDTGAITVNGAELTYDIAGAGHPLVLVHGGLGDRRMWDDQMDAFAQHYRVIRYDQHGYGDSPMPPGPVAYHEDLRGLLQALDIPRAYIVGLSYGASVATDFTLSHPEMVAAFFSVASVIGGISAETMSRIDEADEAGESGDLDRAVELELRIWIDGTDRAPNEVDPDVRERVRAMNRAAWENTATENEVINLDPPAHTRLGEIRAPTLIVIGERDIPDVLTTADILERGIPGARRVTIPNAAHHPQMEQPEIFNRAVLDFLSAM